MKNAHMSNKFILKLEIPYTMDSKNPSLTTRRKDEHLKICVEEDVTYKTLTTGFEKLRIEPNLLVDIPPDEVDLSTHLLGKNVDFPLIITGITGGSEKGQRINQQIAEICNEFNIAMGVGSQRAALENPNLCATYEVRNYAPSIPLFANIGIAQLRDLSGVELAQKTIEMIDADSLAIHINPLQEYVQAEGNRDLSGTLSTIKELVTDTSFPITIKGVGTGLTRNDAKKILDSGADIIDVAGAGGTNWTRIELLRNASKKHFSDSFIEWGVSTADSIRNAVEERKSSSPKIIGSGGVWSGMDAVKALLLGADYVGLALPVLTILMKQGMDAARSFLESYIWEMKIILSLLNIPNLKELENGRKDFFL